MQNSTHYKKYPWKVLHVTNAQKDTTSSFHTSSLLWILSSFLCSSSGGCFIFFSRVGWQPCDVVSRTETFPWWECHKACNNASNTQCVHGVTHTIGDESNTETNDTKYHYDGLEQLLGYLLSREVHVCGKASQSVLHPLLNHFYFYDVQKIEKIV